MTDVVDAQDTHLKLMESTEHKRGASECRF